MSESDEYLLGYRAAEQDRLGLQALKLADDSMWLFERVGVSAGQHVVDVGCGPRGCLDLLAALVGPTGTVVGIEPSEDAADRARMFVAGQRLSNVEVRVGDGRKTGLDRDAFDAVMTRLVLVNVPRPEELVAEAVAIARPGGVVAYHEVAWPLQAFDPPLAAWDRLYEMFVAHAELHGIDLFVGRRLARLLREHGLQDVHANAVTHVLVPEDARRMLPLDFVENLSTAFVDDGLVDVDELGLLKAALFEHLIDPNTFLVSALFVQAWGHKPR